MFGRGMKNNEAAKDSSRRDERLARSSFRWVISALCDITEGGFFKRETRQKGVQEEVLEFLGSLLTSDMEVSSCGSLTASPAMLLLTGDQRRNNQ